MQSVVAPALATARSFTHVSYNNDDGDGDFNDLNDNGVNDDDELTDAVLATLTEVSALTVFVVDGRRRWCVKWWARQRGTWCECSGDVHLCSLLCCFLGSASALVTFVCVLCTLRTRISR
jgi:hypothetical protein